jgi:hypothetical protein
LCCRLSSKWCGHGYKMVEYFDNYKITIWDNFETTIYLEVSRSCFRTLSNLKNSQTTSNYPKGNKFPSKNGYDTMEWLGVVREILKLFLLTLHSLGSWTWDIEKNGENIDKIWKISASIKLDLKNAINLVTWNTKK